MYEEYSVPEWVEMTEGGQKVRKKQLVQKKRKVKQLFIKGDTVVLVAPITEKT